MQQGAGVVILALVVVSAGFIMPAEYTTQEERCTQPGTLENSCEIGGYDNVQVQKDNPAKVPTIALGISLLVVGMFKWGDESIEDESVDNE